MVFRVCRRGLNASLAAARFGAWLNTPSFGSSSFSLLPPEKCLVKPFQKRYGIDVQLFYHEPSWPWRRGGGAVVGHSSGRELSRTEDGGPAQGCPFL
jgi:hypothetical protein